MSVSEPNTLIPYSTAYLIHYFYNSKARATAINELQIRIQYQKVHQKIKPFFFTLPLLDPTISNFNVNKPTPYLYTKL